ncbi:MAG: DUF3267 domain-containing protein [Clostridia bacterium]|nr:DUF3267 domain-containing protein [Clostridia bacterium]
MEKDQNARLEKRKNAVQAISDKMIQDGYQRHDLSLDLRTANTHSIVSVLPFCVLFVCLFGFIAGWNRFAEINVPILLVAFIISLFIHEGIHGLFYGIFAKNHFRAIEFGVIWKSLNPYCYCKDPLSKSRYLIAVLMPGAILGGIIGIIGVSIASANLVLFSVISFIGASGDFYVAWKLINYPSNGKCMLVLDHPELPGCILFTGEPAIT